MKGVSVERLTAGWGKAIVHLHKRAFPPEAVELTILGCAGISVYLDSLLAIPGLQKGHVFLGAVENRRLLGYAHFRRISETWHLNNIAVAPERSGKGIGTDLLATWIGRERRSELSTLSLDVDMKSEIALAWYRRRGFEETIRTWTYRRPLERLEETPDNGDASGIVLTGWEGAEAWQRVYGFSSFDICRNMQSWKVGRLGDSFFRVSYCIQPWLERALLQLAPSRELLTLLSEPICRDGGQLVSESIRMQKTF